MTIEQWSMIPLWLSIAANLMLLLGANKAKGPPWLQILAVVVLLLAGGLIAVISYLKGDNLRLYMGLAVVVLMVISLAIRDKK